MSYALSQTEATAPLPSAPTALGPVTVQSPVIVTCPHCSILHEGSCVPCPPGDVAHPACVDCDGPVYRPPPAPAEPWYRNEFVMVALTSVIAGVATALIVPALVRVVTGKQS